MLHGKPRGHKCAGDGRGTGNDLDGKPRIEDGIHQALAGIGHTRHTRIRDKRHLLPPLDAAKRGSDALRQAVLVRPPERRTDTEVGQQPARHPRVLA